MAINEERITPPLKYPGRKERPILFNGDMVRAILDGKKTQTRRVMKPQPTPATSHSDCYPWITKISRRDHSIIWCTPKGDGGIYKDRDDRSPFRCPYGDPGDILWVRETWAHVPRTAYGSLSNPDPDDPDMAFVYRASFDRAKGGFGWKPSIHMPRTASRTTLKITDVRIERVQDISSHDAFAEGSRCSCVAPVPDCAGNIKEFRNIWDSINEKRGYGWNQNPWVWVIEFQRTAP